MIAYGSHGLHGVASVEPVLKRRLEVDIDANGLKRKNGMFEYLMITEESLVKRLTIKK